MVDTLSVIYSGFALVLAGFLALLFGQKRPNGNFYFLPPNIYFALFSSEMESRYKRVPLMWARGFVGVGTLLSLSAIFFDILAQHF